MAIVSWIKVSMGVSEGPSSVWVVAGLNLYRRGTPLLS
jgi:hypothetical protein